MPKRRGEVWEPPAGVAALMPEVSGNAINGRGERGRRRPTPVMWHNPKRIAHGRIQARVNERYESHPDLQGVFNIPERRADPVPIADDRSEDSTASWRERVKAFALANEADLVGITRVADDWVFEGFEVHEPWIIVLGVIMDHTELSTAPEPPAAVEVARQYNRGTRAARALADWIRSQGYAAEGHGGPSAGPLNLIPAALQAGFGELGKHGSIINRQHGSSLRLAGVLTELPLVADQVDEFGADDFCLSCQLCTNACPPYAITEAKQVVRGETKWYVDFDRCMPYFAENYGCGICIAVCPWSRPGTAPRLAEKMTRRRTRPTLAGAK